MLKLGREGVEQTQGKREQPQETLPILKWPCSDAIWPGASPAVWKSSPALATIASRRKGEVSNAAAEDDERVPARGL